MTYSELKTIGDYIRYATSRFNEAGLYYGHGTDNAWDEALSLILPSLHLPHNINPVVLNAHLTKVEQAKLAKLIERRIQERIPVPYLTHQAWFSGLNFYVDNRVLIPRSPLAELIENHFEPWHDPDRIEGILDLCTGSGCIAIACAKQFPNARVDASDISEDALAVAKINLLRHKVDNQVTLYHSSLFKTIPPYRYDIIISNPPYVSLPEMSTLPPEYSHEPDIGLLGGADGLDFIHNIIMHAGKYLKPDGILIVETGNSAHALSEKYREIPFTWLELAHDQDGVFMLTANELQSLSNTEVE